MIHLRGWRSWCALASFAFSVCFLAPSALQGTSAHLLVDANPASPAANAAAFYKPPSQFAGLDGRVLFFVEEANLGIDPPKPGPGLQLWVTDGTVEGTEPLAEFCTDETVICEFPFRSSFLGRIGSSWLFSVPRVQADGHLDLWRSDGTPGGTFLVKPDICPDPADLSPVAVVAGGSLFFAGFDAEAGCELWRSDGTAAGTGRVADLSPGTDDSSPRSFTALGGRAFFTRDLPFDEGGFWVTDGTAEGTSLVAALPRVDLLTTVGNRMFFAAPDNHDHSFVLWTSDGTVAGTLPLRHFAVFENCETHDCFPVTGFLKPDGDGVLFVADDGDGQNFWRSDGTPAGTRRLTRLSGSAGPGFGGEPLDGDLASVTGSVLVLVTQAKSVRLWASHGGPATPLAGCPGGCPAVHSALAPVPGGRRVVFSGWNGRSKGTELWTSDGTAAGTHLVRDLCTSHCSSDPYNFLALGDAVYFTAVDEDGPGLWRTDGTAAGTVFLGRAFAPHTSPPALPPGGAVLGDQVVLGLESGSGVSQLWVTAGSAASTRPLATFDRAAPPAASGLRRTIRFTAGRSG
jgi:ELWxxDGT repeat protein